MIRVLQIVPNMHAAGLETLLMNLYRNIDRSEIQFDFLTHYSKKFFYDDEIEKLGGHIFRLSFREDNNVVKYIQDLENFFKYNKYDIVHCHMASTSMITLRLAKKYGVPVRILHSHNTSTEHNLKGYIKSIALKKGVKYANYYFACGEEAGKYLFDNRPFSIIHNAIDLKRFQNAAYPNDSGLKKLKQENKFILGHIGRFNSQKNHKFLIQVFEKVKKTIPNAMLLLIGEGELEDEIRNMIIQKDLIDSVLMLGVRKDIPQMYKLFDMFLLPSFFEGLPVVGIEAQAAGIPIIMSDTITKEVQLTDYVERLPINQGIDCWVEKIFSQYTNPKSMDSQKEYRKLVNAGYDINLEATQLLQKYKLFLNMQENKK